MTTKPRSRDLHIEVGGLDEDSFAMVDQIRTVDFSRLSDPIGTVSLDVISRIERALIMLLGLN